VRLAHASVALLLAAGAAADALAQQRVPPPCTSVKGRVVSVDPKGLSVTLERLGRQETFPVGASGAARVGELRAGDQATLKLDCQLKPPPVIAVEAVTKASGPAASATRADQGGPRQTPVLVSAAEACQLSVDFKPWGALAAGGRTELRLGPGEHLLEASTADGRSWKEKVKVGADQLIVEVKLGPPTATEAQYDAQAGRVCGALAALHAAGQDLDTMLRSKGFKFHKAEATAVATAAASWTRDLAALQALVAPAARERVGADLVRLDADVREYADLMVKALETAQERNTIMGEASTLRAKAQAKRSLLTVPSETTKLVPACSGAAGAKATR
jgi:hypothetical protein